MDTSRRTSMDEHEQLHRLGIYCRPDLPGMTKAAQDFLSVSHEVVHFIFIPYSIADDLDRTLELMKSTTKSDIKLINHRKLMDSFDPIAFDLLNARIIDLFLSYISDLLAQIFLKNPRMLKSDKEFTAEEILSHNDYADLVNMIAEKTVNSLSREGFVSMSALIEKRYGLTLVADKTEFEEMLLANEFRNLYVHQRGIVNNTYLKRVPNSKKNTGDELHTSGLGWISLVAKIVLELDKRVIDKFSIEPSANSTVVRRCGKSRFA